MKRGEFLKTAGLGLAAAAINPSYLIPSDRPEIRSDMPKDAKTLQRMLYEDAYSEAMDSSERVWFDGDDAWVNVLPSPGKNLDIRVYAAETEGKLYTRMPETITGIKDSHDMHLGSVYGGGPRLFYVVEYSDGKGWNSLPVREVKTPNVDLENGGKIKIVFIGDNHNYADLKWVPDKEWLTDILRGDYVIRMLEEIDKNPGYEPEVRMREIVQGFSHAWTCKYILDTKPDFVVDLGDEVGTDSYGVWGNEGQWPDHLQPKDAYEKQAKILWERSRRTLAPITPEIPHYRVSGNHDGENGWEPFTDYSREQRKRLFGLPEFEPVYFSPVNSSSVKTSISSLSNDRKFSLPFPKFNGNHYDIKWANREVQLIALNPLRYVNKKPEKVTDWTLGGTQKNTFEKCLRTNEQVPWKFILFHHVVGGYPLGPGTNWGAYARGPLYTREDYERANEMAKFIDLNATFNPDHVEQVWITELAKKYNARGFLRGHDHVFYSRNEKNKPIGKTSLGKEMITACVGSTNYVAGNEYNNIWCNPYWREFCGYFYDNPPPFLTQPGITQLEIDKDGATIKYVCSAPPGCMNSNMPSGTKPGDVVFEYRIQK